MRYAKRNGSARVIHILFSTRDQTPLLEAIYATWTYWIHIIFFFLSLSRKLHDIATCDMAPPARAAGGPGGLGGGLS
jgi:hypothetical protein